MPILSNKKEGLFIKSYIETIMNPGCRRQAGKDPQLPKQAPYIRHYYYQEDNHQGFLNSQNNLSHQGIGLCICLACSPNICIPNLFVVKLHKFPHVQKWCSYNHAIRVNTDQKLVCMQYLLPSKKQLPQSWMTFLIIT